jgi:hypothetical protein
MKNSLIVIALITMLSGCVVAPTPYYTVGYNPNYLVYPVYESAYIYDPVPGTYFFWYGGHRHYMERGWGYRTHGVPDYYGHYERRHY